MTDASAGDDAPIGPVSDRTDCAAGASGERFAFSRRRMRLMYDVRLVTPRVIPASSSSHLQMLLMVCPTASAASISGQSARTWPALVAGFSARRNARRVRAWAIQFSELSVSRDPDTVAPNSSHRYQGSEKDL